MSRYSNWTVALKNLTIPSPKEYGRLWNLGLEKCLNAESRAWRASLAGSWKPAVLELGGCEGCLVQEVLEESRDFNSSLDRDHSWDILAKTPVAFCHCKNLLEAKLKNKGVISLVEEISRLSNVEFMVWLLLTTLLQVYSEKSKGQRECRCPALREKEPQEASCFYH